MKRDDPARLEARSRRNQATMRVEILKKGIGEHFKSCWDIEDMRDIIAFINSTFFSAIEDLEAAETSLRAVSHASPRPHLQAKEEGHQKEGRAMSEQFEGIGFQPIIAETVDQLVTELREFLRDKSLAICALALDRLQEEVSAQQPPRRFARRRYRSYSNPNPEPSEEPLQ